MKKLNLFLLVLLCIMSNSLIAQQTHLERAQTYLNAKGEVIFTFEIDSKSALSSITKELSIVHYDQQTNKVKVMANADQFSSFIQKKIPFNVSPKDNVIGYRTMTSDLQVKAATFPLTAYPTYNDYVGMMNEFASNHPTLCKVENIGATTEGDKSILFVKLSDNVNDNEKEPRVMYTSSMHGDEIAGYPMMLNLIDYLLKVYNDINDPKHLEIKNLLDNNEVWINPLANPDGTYRNSPNNTSVANATRGNANNVDLNRNYPDPDDGANPDGNAYQTETLAFMNFAESKHFVLSANFHGGIELINYPWDTYAGDHPDKDYFLHISEEYRDLCQANSPNGYFDGLNNGITNGFAWYEVQGGRQDYQIYNHKGREVTVELSNAKTPPANQLVNFWNYNKEALIAFLKQVNYGIRGVVTDAVTNQPIEAKVTIIGKENYESWVPTELPEGDYYRPVKSGTYSILYEASCYESLTVTGVSISDYESMVKDVQLTPIAGDPPAGLTVTDIQSASVVLSWQSTNGATYDIRYRKIGVSNWITASASSSTLSITGLSPLTEYEAQVRGNCAGGPSSPFSTSTTFSTTAVPACAGISSFPYIESFESDFGAWINATGDDMDWTRDSGGTPSNNTGPSSGQDGDFYIFTEASGTNSPNKTAILDSPCIDLSSLSNATLEFGYHMYGATMGTMELLVSVDNGGSYSSLWSKSGDLGNVWSQATLDLSAYAGAVIKLQFKGTTGSNWRSDMAIDNIKIQSSIPDNEAPSVPANLVSSNVTGSSVTLSWGASTDNVGVAAYEVYQGDNLINSVTGLTYAVTGLSASTSYAFKIRAKDGAGNNSDFSNVITATTSQQDITYCASQGNNIDFEYIDLVSIGSLNNTSTATSGYSDFTNLPAVAIPYGGNSITLSVGFVGNSYLEYWGVWIDYNQNGTFEDSEKIVSASTRSSANESYDFTVPNAALGGETRMRVSMKYNSEQTACETFAYGEVEDYTVDIGGSVTKGLTSNILTSKITLYPNPIQDDVLFIKGVSQSEATYTIYNYVGQRFANNTLLDNAIDVSSLRPGMYILEIHSGAETITKRFVVTK